MTPVRTPITWTEKNRSALRVPLNAAEMRERNQETFRRKAGALRGWQKRRALAVAESRNATVGAV